MNHRDFPDDEAAVLGGMILDRHRVDDVVGVASPADFTDSRLRELFVVIVDLQNTGERWGIDELVGTLRDSDSFDRIGGAATIGALSAAIGDPSSTAFYAGRVRTGSIVRRLQATLTDAIERTRHHGCNPSELLDHIDIQLLALRDAEHDQDSIVQIVEPATTLCDALDEAAETQVFRGLRTGLHCFDKVNGGFQDGTLNVFAARPSNGKSVLGLQSAMQIGSGFEYSCYDGDSYFVGRQDPTPTLFVSLEMTRAELSARALSSVTEIDSRRINSYRVTAEQRRRLRRAAESLSSSKCFLDQPFRATVSSIRARARIQQRKHGLGCLIVDYLQLIDSENGAKHDKETYRIGEICRHLKSLALELDIPVIVLCQLNREAESKLPTLANLADSGQIEQHTDTVTSIHRQSRASTNAVLSILKWRNGQTADIEVEFDLRHSRFKERAVADHQSRSPSDGLQPREYAS